MGGEKYLIKHKKHKLYHGDCLAVMDELIGNGVKVDAIISDPTFGTTNRINDNVLNFEEMWKRILLLRKNKNTPILLFSNGMNTAELMMSNKKMWKYNWVWNKILPSGMLNANRMPLTDYDEIHEFNLEDIDPYIQTFYEKQSLYNKQMAEGKPEHGNSRKGSNKNGKLDCEENNYNSYNYVEGNKGNTLKNPTRIISIPKDHSSVVIHSQQKPIGLGEYLVKTFTNEGDVVLDFMMGSGFVILGCEIHNREGIGIDNGYCDKKKFESYYKKPWNYVVKNRLISEV